MAAGIDTRESAGIAAVLTPAAARSLTKRIRDSASQLWADLLRAYEGGAHTALGYSSWGAYYEAEFGGSDATGYRLLQSARVMGQLPIGSPRPSSEAVARELAPVLREHPAAQVEQVWGEVVEQHGAKPTAAQVRETVSKRAAGKGEEAGASRAAQNVADFVTYVSGAAHGIAGTDLPAMRAAMPDDRARALAKELRTIRTTITRLISALEETP